MVSSTGTATPAVPPRPPPHHPVPTLAGRVEQTLAAHLPDDLTVLARKAAPARVVPAAQPLRRRAIAPDAFVGFAHYGAVRVVRPRRQSSKTSRRTAAAPPATVAAVAAAMASATAARLCPPPAPVIRPTPAPAPPLFDELDCDCPGGLCPEPLCL